MLDFFVISKRTNKQGTIEVYPRFVIRASQDLMIRGGDFYAIWNEEEGLWSTSEEVALYLIDKELDNFADKLKQNSDDKVKVLHLWDAETGMIDKWHKYVQKQMRDSFHPLDEKLIFSNTPACKKDYASKRLNYPLEPGSIEAYEELISTLYSPEERKKIEWAIGSIVTGESAYLQKFIVMYGSAGTGKSTILNIIFDLFSGYCSVFDAKALGSNNNAFALECFKSNPLVAIQHDGDLSRIEDNTRLNSIVSHELMTVNEKFKSTYSNRFKAFLFMGTNRPVKITDAKSGILRRLIDVSPSGNKVKAKRYKELTNQIKFELSGIAYHCKEVYLNNKDAYDNYTPISMMGASNDFYNYVLNSFDIFKSQNGTTLASAWAMYKDYCEDAKVPKPLSQRLFKEELKNYFSDFLERSTIDGVRVWNYYGGFEHDRLFEKPKDESKEEDSDELITFTELRANEKSMFDITCAECPAQFANDDGNPIAKWDRVTSKLEDLDPTQLHYVRVPVNHIVIDFDIPDENGEKSLERNLIAASKWPKTYAELSKSGKGIHLHYIYTGGDPEKLSRVYADHIEVKVFSGKSSLRRKLSKCCNIAIATLASGLPMKGEKKVVNASTVKSEKALRSLIIKNLKKEIHPGTKPSIDFIYKILEDAYKSGLHYDVTTLRPDILAFASKSTHQAPYCIKLVNQMHFASDNPADSVRSEDNKPLIFYDVEVFPNLFLVNWKKMDSETVVRMINPSSAEIEELCNNRLVGFNCRRYDNHIMYARIMGYNNEQLYNLSQKIVNGSSNAFFGEAYNLSYADVYDFSSKKQSLKKFEIELGIHHQELGLPWDQPVPERLWNQVAEYCDNDVIATEAVFKAREQDFIARKILADISGLSVNDTTRMHTTKIIFGNERHPKLVYTDLSEMFPGYKYDNGVSTYRGEETGEGGLVRATPGMYEDVALLDIASMHPSSIRALNMFGEYTKRFTDILDARLYIKHHDFEKAGSMLGGAFKPYLTDVKQAKQLAQALKIVINSVYGYTTATFDNPFKDPRNIDNIVAKRGALFMINLKHEVEERGFEVAHIKTDSIKIPNATPDIIKFVQEYGKQYGYNFEHEATYKKMCLVNDAVYIAKYMTAQEATALYGYSPDECVDHGGQWTATGTQFQIPYVFKTLFSHEPIEFKDMCETKQVSTNLYLDYNEQNPDEHDYRFVGKVGLFCPIKPGCGGATLVREGKDKEGNVKYSAATGSKGYRWLESELVESLGNQDDIDRSYYIAMVDDAVATISQYGDFEAFVS